MKFTHKVFTAALSLSLLMPFAAFSMNWADFLKFSNTCNSSVELKAAYDKLDTKNDFRKGQFNSKFAAVVKAEAEAKAKAEEKKALSDIYADEVRWSLAQREVEKDLDRSKSTWMAYLYDVTSEKVANGYNWVTENPKKSVVIALGTGAAIYGGYKYRDAIKNNGSLVLGKGKDAVVYTKDCVTGSRPYNWVTSWFTKPEVKKTLTQKGLEKAKNIKNKAKNIKDGAKEGVKSAYNAVFKK